MLGRRQSCSDSVGWRETDGVTIHRIPAGRLSENKDVVGGG